MVGRAARDMRQMMGKHTMLVGLRPGDLVRSAQAAACQASSQSGVARQTIGCAVGRDGGAAAMAGTEATPSPSLAKS